MAGLSDVSKIKNHQQRERARASTDSETDDISPDDIMLHAPGWNSNDDERFQDEIARRAEEKKQY